MRDTLRHFMAELVGTFALTFVGGAAIMNAQDSSAGLLQVAFAHGLILALMVTATMRVSGHFNPAVSLAFAATGRLEVRLLGAYVAAQLIGAVLAAAGLRALFPGEAFAATAGGGQALAAGVSAGQGLGLEIIATFFLTFVIWGTAVDPRAPRVGGFAIGLTVAANILALGPLTGASMNPARSFGPALLAGFPIEHWLYWVGPIVGALLGALLYEHVLLHHPHEPEGHGAVRA